MNIIRGKRWLDFELLNWLVSDPLEIAKENLNYEKSIRAKSTFAFAIGKVVAFIRQRSPAVTAMNVDRLYVAVSVNQQKPIYELYSRDTGSFLLLTANDFSMPIRVVLKTLLNLGYLILANPRALALFFNYPRLILAAVWYFHFFNYMFRQIKPKTVIFSNNSNSVGKSIICAAFRCEAKLAFVPHALLSASKVFEFGKIDLLLLGNNISAKMALERGAKIESIKIVGHLCFEPKENSDSSDISSCDALILTNPLLDVDAHFSQLEEILKKHQTIILKLHPQESLGKYSRIVTQYPNLRLTKSNSVRELAKIAQTVYSCYSSAVYEVMLEGKKVALIGEIPLGDPYWLENLCRESQNSNPFLEDRRPIDVRAFEALKHIRAL